jgi:peroxiredoxin
MLARGVAVLGISGDSPPCHAAFVKTHGAKFPQLSDLHRTAITAYEVLDEERNVAYRSTFVVDRDGVLRWGQAGDRLMIRDGKEILRVLNVIEGQRTH